MSKKKTSYYDTPAYKNKVIKNKNSYVGRTYKMNDDDLPHDNEGSGKVVNFAVIEENGKRLGGVRTTTKNTLNAKPFRTKHRLYKGYKTFLETQFHNGDDIIADDERLKENPWLNNLTRDNLNEIKETLYISSRQSKTNKRISEELKKK